LVKCFSQEKLPNLISILNGRWVLGNAPAVQNACSNTASILEELQRAVIITLDLSHPDVFLAHCMTEPSNEALEITGSSEGFIRDSTVECGVNWCGEKILFRSPSVDDAVKSIGSVKILLFLYAKFVNDSMPAALQIAALDVLFSSLRRNHAFAEEANRMHLNNILVKALSSRLAYFGDEIVQLIIDHCIAWENTEDDTSASSILDRAIIFCSSECLLEMLRNSVSFTDPSDYQEMIADVVMIVCALISPPWDAKTVSLLWNFITISHPASATYLKHDVQGSSDWTNKRTSCDAQSDFLRMDGFRILANQLAGFPVTHAMADSLFSLLCAEPIFLADG
uniref:DUF4704 domain-containing protein n=1 Tax=Angiostrongylus cantonensis TaxID=6313 RepID=A0A0K0DR57_ANGCA